MTNEEIIQYLEIIKPVYSPAIKANLSRIEDKFNEMQGERKRLNRLIFDQPEKPVNQTTLDKERERQKAIKDQVNILDEKITKLRAKQHIARYMAQKQGIRDEWIKLGKMPRNEISDAQRQAELLNILDNRCLQLKEVCRLIEATGVAQPYLLSFGEPNDLRGTWEDAIEVVSLSIDDNDAPDSSEHPNDETTITPPEMPWIQFARKSGQRFVKEFPRLSLEQIATKVHQDMLENKIKGRGGRLPVASTIKRRALTGIKA